MSQVIRGWIGLIFICFALTVHAQDFEATKRAAELGDVKAQFNLGWVYGNGQGVAKDEAEAVKWYRKAAEQGDAKAQFNLGLMYANGQGVAKDDSEATKWFRKAAEQGNKNAPKRLPP